MDERIRIKVQQLKNSFTVEGVPLVKSNRFSDEELGQMRKESTAHESHWYGMAQKSKVWTDEEIANQIEVFLATPTMSERKFKDIVSAMLKSLPIEDKDRERQVFKELLYGILNWTEEKNGISTMWRPFGSAPVSGMSGKHVERVKKLYGATHMNDIFDGQFADKFHVFWYGVNNALQEFETHWDEEKRKKDLKSKSFSSPYKNLDDIEENVVMKKIPEAAREFYLDRTKKFEDRVEVFSKHGNFKNFIFEPTDSDLQKIFQVYTERDLERHETINTADVVWSWIDKLKNNRCELDWTNQYHPKVRTSARNYKPSDESVERLYRYYMEKLFLDEVGSFEFDW